MRRPCRRSPLENPGDHPKSTKKRYEKQVLKKRSLKRPLGCHGEPRGAPGSQNEAKMDAKRLPKEVKKHCILNIGWKTQKCDENILYTTLWPHRPPQKMTIFRYFRGLKMRRLFFAIVSVYDCKRPGGCWFSPIFGDLFLSFSNLVLSLARHYFLLF